MASIKNTKKINKIVNFLIPKYKGNMNSMHISCLVTGGKTRSIGWNHNRSTNSNKPLFSIHAEQHSILKELNKSKEYSLKKIIKDSGKIPKNTKIKKDVKKIFRNTGAIVIRLNKNGELVNSKPCIKCLSYYKFCGIKYVIYSNNQGDMIKEKISEMNHCFPTTTHLRYLNTLF